MVLDWVVGSQGCLVLADLVVGQVDDDRLHLLVKMFNLLEAGVGTSRAGVGSAVSETALSR